MIFAEAKEREYMYKFTEAKILTIEEIKENVLTESRNPTLERMMFMEQRKEDKAGIFPCWIEAYGEKEDGTVVSLIISVSQYRDGQFELLRFRLGNVERDYNVKFRFWDQPPTEGLREDHPFVDSEVAQ